jgi:hypothetical protein
MDPNFGSKRACIQTGVLRSKTPEIIAASRQLRKLQKQIRIVDLRQPQQFRFQKKYDIKGGWKGK